MKSSMNRIDRPDVVGGPVVSEGGRGPSTLSTGRAAPSAAIAPQPGPLAPGQRWSVGRKREVVLRLMCGEPAELLSRELGLPIFKLEHSSSNTGARRPKPRSWARRRSARRIRPTANSPPPCSASASSAWKSSCSARGLGQCPIGANFRGRHGIAPCRTGSFGAGVVAPGGDDRGWRLRRATLRRSTRHVRRRAARHAAAA